MTAIIDYGRGNLFSLRNALNFLGIENKITSDESEISSASRIILPGVGAFPDAMEQLKKRGLVEIIKKEAEKKPLLGICLGMQILFEKGHEFSDCDGLGLIPGEVIPIDGNGMKIPHMGWNELVKAQDNPLINGIGTGEYVYFVHSYRAETQDKYIAAYCEYSEKIPALVCNGNIYGAQFHPEKSGSAGLRILSDFAAL